MKTVSFLIFSILCYKALASKLPTSPKCFSIEKVSEGSAKIISYHCDDQSIEIPSQIDNLKIIAIGASSFEGQKLVSVLIPQSVEVIETKAFHQSYLEHVSIPESVKIIEGFAFWYCELTEVRLPKNIRELGYGAFSMNNIKNIILPNALIKIGPATFYHNKLETAVLSNGLSEIPEMAFSGNKLKSIEIPDQVRSIGQVAFSDNLLLNVILPKSLEVIGRGAFRNNLLQEITLISNLKLIDVDAFSQNQLVNIQLPKKVDVIESGAFKQNLLSYVKVPGKTFLKDSFDQKVQVERFGPSNSGLWVEYNMKRNENSLISEFLISREVLFSDDKRDYILNEKSTNIYTGEVKKTSVVIDPRLVDLERAKERREICIKNGGRQEMQVVKTKEIITCREEQPGWLKIFADAPFGFYLQQRIIDFDSFSLSETTQLLDFGRY